MWDLLTAKLKSILEGSQKFANVYDYEASDFSGTPIATIVPSANDSDYSTTTENRRVYAFVVRMFTKRLSGEANEKRAEDGLRDLVDAVIDDFDKNHRLTGLGSKTGYCFLYLEATPSNWFYLEGDTNYRVAELLLRVHFDVDVTNIS